MLEKVATQLGPLCDDVVLLGGCTTAMYADEKLKFFLQQSFKEMLEDRGFHDALSGHFNLYGNLAEDRIDLFLDNIEQIISS